MFGNSESLLLFMYNWDCEIYIRYMEQERMMTSFFIMMSSCALVWSSEVVHYSGLAYRYQSEWKDS